MLKFHDNNNNNNNLSEGSAYTIMTMLSKWVHQNNYVMQNKLPNVISVCHSHPHHPETINELSGLLEK